MKKRRAIRWYKTLPLILFLVLLLLVFFFQTQLNILTSYAAKMGCSCYYITGMDRERILREDLNYFPINWADIEIDTVNQLVTASLLHTFKNTAEYKENLGCQLRINNKQTSSPAGTFANHIYRKDTQSMTDLYFKKNLNSFDTAELRQAFIDAFDKNFEIKSKKTKALLVLQGDSIVAEKYANGYDENYKFLGWSMSKSIASLLIGILIDNHRLSLDQDSLFQSWNMDQRRDIQLDHLIHMKSGLKWNEDYGSKSDVTMMLYTQSDMSKYVEDEPLNEAPDTKWLYSSGTTNLLSALIRKQFANYEDYLKFPYDSLFLPMGIESAQLELDGVGNYILSSYSYMGARDWAKLGLLWLRNGMYRDKQIVSSEWIKYTQMPTKGSEGNYGAHVWLNVQGKDYNQAPKDMICFKGYQGQYVVVLPSYDLVIVRLGLDYDNFDINTSIGEILRTMRVH